MDDLNAKMILSGIHPALRAHAKFRSRFRA